MKLNRLVGVCVLTFGCSAAFANIVAWQSLTALAESADLIVVGTGSGTGQAGAVLNFNVYVVRVVKGDQTVTGTNVAVTWSLPATSPSSPAVSSGATAGTGLWFLQRSSAGWTLLPVITGGVLFNQTYIPGGTEPLPTGYIYPASAPLSDKIASEVGSAIESGTATTAQIFGLYFGPLDQLNSPITQVIYRRLSSSTLTNQQILGFAGRIREGDSTAVIGVAAVESSLAKYPIESSILLASLRNDFRATDAQSVTALGQIASAATSNTALREAAAHALAAIHTREALPSLAALLDDNDASVRAEGVGGLGAFANGLPVQTSAANSSLSHLQLPPTAPYKTEATVANFAQGLQTVATKEAGYISFWKSWWTENRSSLGY